MFKNGLYSMFNTAIVFGSVGTNDKLQFDKPSTSRAGG
jgi:hypothetical protein